MRSSDIHSISVEDKEQDGFGDHGRDMIFDGLIAPAVRGAMDCGASFERLEAVEAEERRLLKRYGVKT